MQNSNSMKKSSKFCEKRMRNKTKNQEKTGFSTLFRYVKYSHIGDYIFFIFFSKIVFCNKKNAIFAKGIIIYNFKMFLNQYYLCICMQKVKYTIIMWLLVTSLLHLAKCLIYSILPPSPRKSPLCIDNQAVTRFPVYRQLLAYISETYLLSLQEILSNIIHLLSFNLFCKLLINTNNIRRKPKILFQRVGII